MTGREVALGKGIHGMTVPELDVDKKRSAGGDDAGSWRSRGECDDLAVFRKVWDGTGLGHVHRLAAQRESTWHDVREGDDLRDVAVQLDAKDAIVVAVGDEEAGAVGLHSELGDLISIHSHFGQESWRDLTSNCHARVMCGDIRWVARRCCVDETRHVLNGRPIRVHALTSHRLAGFIVLQENIQPMQERRLDDWTGPKIGPCPNLPQSIAASRIPLPSGGAFMPLKDLWCTCSL
jgi:hypothetical protein